MNDLIDLLSKQQLVWKGRFRKGQINDCSNPDSVFTPSGYQELDQKIGGLPKVGVLNINSMLGIGELRLLLPVLIPEQESSGYNAQGDRRVGRQEGQGASKLCVFINPPGRVCAEFLYHQGFDLKHVLIVQARDKNDALWAAESCAKSGACSSVLLWNNYFETHQIKRLQIASEEGECLQVLLRSPNHLALSLPVSLSLKLMPHNQGLMVDVIKRKGGWPVSSFTLDMYQHWPALSDQTLSDRILSDQTLLDRDADKRTSNVLLFPALQKHSS